MDFGTDYTKVKPQPSQRSTKHRDSFEAEPVHTPNSWKQKFGNNAQSTTGVAELGLDFSKSRNGRTSTFEVETVQTKSSGMTATKITRSSREITTCRVETFGTNTSSLHATNSRHVSGTSPTGTSPASRSPASRSPRSRDSSSSESAQVSPSAASPSVRDMALRFQGADDTTASNVKRLSSGYEGKNYSLTPKSPTNKDAARSRTAGDMLKPKSRSPTGPRVHTGRSTVSASYDEVLDSFGAGRVPPNNSPTPRNRRGDETTKLLDNYTKSVAAKPWQSTSSKTNTNLSIHAPAPYSENATGLTAYRTPSPEARNVFETSACVIDTVSTIKCETLSSSSSVTDLDSNATSLKSEQSASRIQKITRQQAQDENSPQTKPTGPKTSPKPTKHIKPKVISYTHNYENTDDTNPLGDSQNTSDPTNVGADDARETVTTSAVKWMVIAPSIDLEPDDNENIQKPTWLENKPALRPTPAPRRKSNEGKGPPHQRRPKHKLPTPHMRPWAHAVSRGQVPSITSDEEYDDVLLMEDGSQITGYMSDGASESSRSSARSSRISNTSSVVSEYDDVVSWGAVPPKHGGSLGRDASLKSNHSTASRNWSRRQHADKNRYLSNPEFSRSVDDLTETIYESMTDISIPAIIFHKRFPTTTHKKLSKRRVAMYRDDSLLGSWPGYRWRPAVKSKPINIPPRKISPNRPLAVYGEDKMYAEKLVVGGRTNMEGGSDGWQTDSEDGYEQISKQQSQEQSRYRSSSTRSSIKGSSRNASRRHHPNHASRRRKSSTSRPTSGESISPPVPKRKQSHPDVGYGGSRGRSSAAPPVPPRFELQGLLSDKSPPPHLPGPDLPPRTYKQTGGTLPRPLSSGMALIEEGMGYTDNRKSSTLPRGSSFEDYIDPLTDLDSVPHVDRIRIVTSTSSDSSGAPSYLQLTDGAQGESSTDGYTRTSCTVTSVFETQELYQVYHCGTVAFEVLTAQGFQSVDDDSDELDTEGTDNEDNSCQQDIYGTFEDLKRLAGSQSQVSINNKLYSVIKSSAGYRTLWCEMPEVRSSGCLEGMSDKDKRLQETMFEVITSEASYFKSLNVLIDNFYNDDKLQIVLTPQDRKGLFSNIVAVRDASKTFMCELENLWNASFMLNCDLCDLIKDFAENQFKAYVTYLTAQHLQDRTLRALMEKNAAFREVLIRIQKRQECQSLPLQSFLALPFQRMTRLPLLMKSIMEQLDASSQKQDYLRANESYEAGKRLAENCNEGAKLWQNIEEISNIEKSLVFKSIKTIALTSKSRSLEKRGQLTRLVLSTGLFGKKKDQAYLFVFNDIVLITKRRSSKEEKFEVLDHCKKRNVAAEIVDSQQASDRLKCAVPGNIKQYLLVVFNHPQKDIQAPYVFTCEKESDLMRWKDSFLSLNNETPENEHLYDPLGCPTMQVLHSYVAQEPDEMSLQEPDIIEVYRKMNDGWYEGLNTRSGEKGWFPSNYCIPVTNSTVPGKIVKEKYQILSKARLKQPPKLPV